MSTPIPCFRLNCNRLAKQVRYNRWKYLLVWECSKARTVYNPGLFEHSQILSHQLTLSLPGRAYFAHYITRYLPPWIFRLFFVPATYQKLHLLNFKQFLFISCPPQAYWIEVLMRLQKIFQSILLPLGGAAVAVGTENSTVVAHGVNRISHCSWECAPPILVVRHYLWFVAPIRLPKTTILRQSETTLTYWAENMFLQRIFLSQYFQNLPPSGTLVPNYDSSRRQMKRFWRLSPESWAEMSQDVFLTFDIFTSFLKWFSQKGITYISTL